MPKTELRYITLGRAARRVGISAERLRVYTDTGRLPHVRAESGIRLIAEGDLERFIKQRAARAVREG